MKNCVVFLGRCEYSKMKHIYAHADIVALPSLRETTSIAVIEAMLGTKEQAVKGRADALSQLVDNPILRLTIGKRDMSASSESISRKSGYTILNRFIIS